MAMGGLDYGGVSGTDLQALIERMEQQNSSVIQTITKRFDRLYHDIIVGEFHAPLTCRDGNPLCTRDGVQIEARRVVSDN